MDEYAIYCTSEQVKKALEFGAQIKYANAYNAYLPHTMIDFVGESGKMECAQFVIPTAEQMIGWLEEQDCIRCVEVTKIFEWHYRVKKKYDDVDDWIQGSCQTRKEATLAAIYAALEFIQNLKQ